MAKTKLVPKSWIPAGPYSLGTQLGNLAFLSGQIATANDGSVIGGGDVKAQTEIVIDKMVEILDEAGMTLDDVLQTTVYLRDMSTKAEMDEVWCEWIGGAENWPQRACVGADLAGNDLVEIVTMAAAT